MTEPYIQTPRTPPPPAKEVNGADRDLSANPVSAEYERESPPGIPRWVKGLGIAFILLALLFGGMHLTGHGGPELHGAEHSIQTP